MQKTRPATQRTASGLLALCLALMLLIGVFITAPVPVQAAGHEGFLSEVYLDGSSGKTHIADGNVYANTSSEQLLFMFNSGATANTQANLTLYDGAQVYTAMINISLNSYARTYALTNFSSFPGLEAGRQYTLTIAAGSFEIDNQLSPEMTFTFHTYAPATATFLIESTNGGTGETFYSLDGTTRIPVTSGQAIPLPPGQMEMWLFTKPSNALTIGLFLDDSPGIGFAEVRYTEDGFLSKKLVNSVDGEPLPSFTFTQMYEQTQHIYGALSVSPPEWQRTGSLRVTPTSGEADRIALHAIVVDDVAIVDNADFDWVGINVFDLLPAFLESLSPGSHTIQVVYLHLDTLVYGYAQGEFTVVGKTYTAAPAELTYTGSGSLAATIDAPYSLFTGSVFWQGNELTRDVDFTDEEGSTVITFNEGWLQTLAVGRHEVTVEFADGSATLAIIVPEPTPEPPPNPEPTPTPEAAPQTGDGANLPLWLVLGALALAGLGLCTATYRRKGCRA